MVLLATIKHGFTRHPHASLAEYVWQVRPAAPDGGAARDVETEC
jgi:hypothetical protein